MEYSVTGFMSRSTYLTAVSIHCVNSMAHEKHNNFITIIHVGLVMMWLEIIYYIKLDVHTYNSLD